MSSSKAHIVNGTVFGKIDRADYDFYTTDPIALEKLLDREDFHGKVLEPAAGLNSLASVLRNRGFEVKTSDIIKRMDDQIERDFFTINKWSGNIITNPPYKLAAKFVEHALNIIPDGFKVAMFLKLTFLEGKQRLKLFRKYNPQKIYVFSERVTCLKEGKPAEYTSAVAYCWIIWEKGWEGNTKLDWIE